MSFLLESGQPALTTIDAQRTWLRHHAEKGVKQFDLGVASGGLGCPRPYQQTRARVGGRVGKRRGEGIPGTGSAGPSESRMEQRWP